MSKKIITIYKDKDCEMAKVEIDVEFVMEGNYWDFHPGCHGIEEYGDFRSANGLALAIQKTFAASGVQSEVKNEVYKYEY